MLDRERYDEWMYKHRLHNPRVARTQCRRFAEKMVEDFPDTLRIAKGMLRYESAEYANGKAVVHWWCVDVNTGEIVDPTEAQYAAVNVLGYEELNGRPVSVPRRCPNCSELFWTDGTCDTCAYEFSRSL